MVFSSPYDNTPATPNLFILCIKLTKHYIEGGSPYDKPKWFNDILTDMMTLIFSNHSKLKLKISTQTKFSRNWDSMWFIELSITEVNNICNLQRLPPSQDNKISILEVELMFNNEIWWYSAIVTISEHILEYGLQGDWKHVLTEFSSSKFYYFKCHQLYLWFKSLINTNFFWLFIK